MNRELLQKVVDWHEKDSSIGGLSVLIEEIEAELEKPEQEPVAWLIEAASVGNAQHWRFLDFEKRAPERLERMFPTFTPLYCSPQQKPLSTKKIVDIQLSIQRKQSFGEISVNDVAEQFARAIERAHGIGE